MPAIRFTLGVVIAGCSLAITACQPANDAAERAGKHVDQTAKKIGRQVDKAADTPKNVLPVGDAK